MFGNNDRNIKDILSEVIGDNKKLKNGVSKVTIEDAWKKQMGDVICSYTERLYFSNGKLTVYLTSAPLRSELTMSKVRLIELLNEECGAHYVEDIILR